MIVQCDNCQTKFNLDEHKLKPEGAWVRCSHCQNVFQVLPPAPATPPAAPAPRPAPADDGEIHLELDRLDAGRRPGDAAEAESDFGLEEDYGQGAKKGGALGRLFKFLFWLVACVVILALLAAGGLVALDRLGLQPRLVDKFRILPGLGPFLTGPAGKPAEPAPDLGKLVLKNTRGYYRTNDKVGRLFVIQGQVENQRQDGRTSVLVRGRLHDTQGNVVSQAVIYAGPSFSPEELRQLSLEDIQARLSQATGPDGSKYVLPSQGTTPFMIVFANLPSDLAEFSVEVVGSEPLKPAK